VSLGKTLSSSSSSSSSYYYYYYYYDDDDDDGWYFRAAAIVLAMAGAVKILRDHRVCSSGGAWTFRRLILVVALVMIAVYAALYALTAWLARLATTG
jgi:hypothetical protein